MKIAVGAVNAVNSHALFTNNMLVLCDSATEQQQEIREVFSDPKEGHTNSQGTFKTPVQYFKLYTFYNELLSDHSYYPILNLG